MDLPDVRRHGGDPNRRRACFAPPHPDPHSRRHGLSGPGILSMIASRRAPTARVMPPSATSAWPDPRRARRSRGGPDRHSRLVEGMCAACALFGASPDMVTLTLSCPLLTFKSAVPDAACDGPEPCCKGTVTALTPPLTSPHAIGENWSCGLSVEPLWTFTYHPVAGAGSCSNEGAVIHPLTDITADSNGQATSSTTVPGVSSIPFGTVVRQRPRLDGPQHPNGIRSDRLRKRDSLTPESPRCTAQSPARGAHARRGGENDRWSRGAGNNGTQTGDMWGSEPSVD